ncbi:MAG: cupin domain-containing protein, partial [Pseudomonadota bacterium]
IPTVHVDNARTRVTEYRFAPGSATGWHRHEYDYVITPLTDGHLRLIGPGGAESEAQLVAGQSYFREAGVEHDVINAGATEIRFVEVEWKG